MGADRGRGDGGPIADPFARGLSRRELVRGFGVLMAGGLGGNLLVACGGEKSAGEAVTGTQPASQATGTAAAARGGELTIGVAGFPSGFDADVSTGVSDFVLRNTLDSLVALGEDLSPQPGLATKWETPDGGTTWVFELAEASWHDGTPFTSKDVKAHFERVLDPDTGSPGAQVYGGIESVDASDPRVAVVKLDAPDADFPTKNGAYQGLIQAAHVDPSTYKDTIVGTGPFKLDQIVAGESVRLVRNPEYFVEGQPILDSVTFVAFDDEQARLNALLAGELDAALELPYDLAGQLQDHSDIALSTSIPAAQLLLAMRVDRPPFDNQKVREAVALSLDREALLQAAVRGFGEAGGDNPIGPGRPYYVDVETRSRDLDAARSLLAEAGYADGLDLELYVPGGVGGAQELALGVQSMAGEAGVRVNVVTIPQDVYWVKYWLQQNFKVTNWSPRGTVDEQFRVTYYCDAAWNEDHWCDERFDQMLDEARGTVEEDQRSQLYGDIQHYFAERVPSIIPFHISLVAGVSKNVKGLAQHSVYYWTDFRTVSVTSA